MGRSLELCVFLNVCSIVCMCLSTWVAAAPLVPSANPEAPISTFCHSPADNLVCCSSRWWERENTWCEHATKTTWILTEGGKNFLSCHSAENSCMLSYSVWLTPLFDLDKKRAWGSPLEVLSGYDVTPEYIFALWATPQRKWFSSKDCWADLSLAYNTGDHLSLCNYTLHRCFSDSFKVGGLWFGGLMSLKCIGSN